MARRSNATVAWASVAIVVAMVGLSYASVPLYDWFCRVTGFGGTTQVAAAAPGVQAGQMVTVRFNADTAQGMAWKFQPNQRSVRVPLGEETLVSYRAHNPTNRTITGTATFNVTPDVAGIYFNQIACFCFSEPVREPGQSVDMPVSFFVDPEILKDKNARGVKEITLSYTFFEKPGVAGKVSSLAPAPSR